MQIALKNMYARRSGRIEIRRQSLSCANMFLGLVVLSIQGLVAGKGAR
jgi:hypothetical protein